MGDLTLNFSRSEFACKGTNCCGHSAPVSKELVDALRWLRDMAKVPLTVNCGFRCVKHNAAVDGAAKTSQHLYGTAADIALPQGYSPVQFAALADSLGLFDGIGIYDWGIHVDVRGTKARWDYRTKK